MHLEKFTVWCGFLADVIIGSYFFQNNFSQANTVNEEYP